MELMATDGVASWEAQRQTVSFPGADVRVIVLDNISHIKIVISIISR